MKLISGLDKSYRQGVADDLRQPAGHRLHTQFLAVEMSHFQKNLVPTLSRGVDHILCQRIIADFKGNQYVGLFRFPDDLGILGRACYMLAEQDGGNFAI